MNESFVFLSVGTNLKINFSKKLQKNRSSDSKEPRKKERNYAQAPSAKRLAHKRQFLTVPEHQVPST